MVVWLPNSDTSGNVDISKKTQGAQRSVDKLTGLGAGLSRCLPKESCQIMSMSPCSQRKLLAVHSLCSCSWVLEDDVLYCS